MSTSRTLIIGLDGATFHLINPLIGGGHLPIFARLMAEGVSGPLQAWPNMNSAAAWSSMVTGYNPGQHGIYHFGDAPPQRGQKWHPTTAADRKKDPFWRLLSAAGQYVGVINVPITYPADRINGFMLSGMDTPSVRSPGFAHPPDLLDELRRHGIDYVIDIPSLGELSVHNPARAMELAHQMVEARSRTILYLMETRPWDVLMAVFVAPDRVQHFFWPPDGSSVDSPEWAPIRALYQQIDSFLGQALKRIDENTTVLLVSDHGFQVRRNAPSCLNRFLAMLGLLHYREAGAGLKSHLLKNLLLYGRKVIPLRFQRPLALMFPGLRLRAGMEDRFSGIHWANTRVFASPFGLGVYINLQGRQPEGTVSQQEYHPLREHVRSILLKLTDPHTGRRVIKAVHCREEVYHGPYLEEAPDLIIEWDCEATGDSLCYPDGTEPIIIQPPMEINKAREWKGTHHPLGIFIAYGPQIKRGASVEKAVIYDIAPTVLYLQGHPVPRDMDGKVLTGMFAEERLRQYPVQHGEPVSAEAQPSEFDLDADEAREIEQRLRDLGYIE